MSTDGNSTSHRLVVARWIPANTLSVTRRMILLMIRSLPNETVICNAMKHLGDPDIGGMVARMPDGHDHDNDSALVSIAATDPAAADQTNAGEFTITLSNRLDGYDSELHGEWYVHRWY